MVMLTSGITVTAVVHNKTISVDVASVANR